MHRAQRESVALFVRSAGLMPIDARGLHVITRSRSGQSNLWRLPVKEIGDSRNGVELELLVGVKRSFIQSTIQTPFSRIASYIASGARSAPLGH